MAGNGPAPSENRRRRNKDTYADVKTTVPAKSATLRGPTLNDAAGATQMELFDRLGVTELVQDWWDTWRRSPLAEAFLDTDWSRLKMMVPLVATYYARPTYSALGEIRQNESLLGATHVDRLKARIKVERPGDKPKAPPAGVTALDAYRRDLAG